ncbi:hypothetical protein ABI59_14515 [Acidobacteria bacterium Mor1]|nr:hypothetical protein ABI59_14515 [Acidobacteria bacterium Mor1]
MLRLYRTWKFPAFLVGYAVVIAAFGLFAIAMLGAGHGVFWPFMVWLLLLAPTSLVIAPLWFFVFTENGYDNTFAILLLFAVPWINGSILWALIAAIVSRIRGSRDATVDRRIEPAGAP